MSAADSHRSILQGGYDANFVLPVADRYKCTICLMVLHEPVQTNCGHRFCRSCIEPIRQKQRPLCPIDKVPIDLVFPDNFCKRDILSLLVECQNKICGCLWKGELRGLERHLSKCDYSRIPCPNAFRGCTVELQRVSLPAHSEKECLFCEASCPHCNEKLPFSELETHKNEACPEKEINCPNQCGLSMKRLNIPGHLAQQCEKTVKACLYNDRGCRFQGLISEMKDHMESSVLYHLHLDLVSQHLPEVATLQARHVQLLLERFSQLHERFAAFELQMSQAITAAVARSRASNERLLVVEKKAGDALQKAEHCEAVAQTSKQKTELCQTKVDAVECEVTKFNTIIGRADGIMADFDLLPQWTSFDGVMIWKIPDYRLHFVEARTGKRPSLYSPPFYTSHHGYKMCARVYLNGDGIGKGTHMSIFFVVMKGDFDAILRWPFRQKVTLTLLDQSPSKRHISDTFMPDPGSSSFQRPLSEMNIASGCPRFVALDTLKHGTYIKDNTIFVRIAVDTTGLAAFKITSQGNGAFQI